jgi:hypothetical protein
LKPDHIGCSALLACSEEAVSGVAKPRKNVAMRIQLAVERGAENPNIRMGLGHPSYSLRCGYDAEKTYS